MKKNVEEVLHKKYHKKLEKLNAYKEKLKRMQMTFREYGVGCVIKDEWSYYQIEIIYESILNKKKFEDTYLTTYVSMHDFWHDLDYQERKHQMNVDIDLMRRELKSFPYENEDIYMPMFDQRMNRLYVQEIVLMELKQYHRYIKKFDDVIQKNMYGILPYVYNFTSCLFICGDESYFCIYNPDVNRLYFIENFNCTHTLNFDPSKNRATTFEELRAIADAYMHKEDRLCAKLISASHLISDRTKKKMKRLAR